MDNEKTINILIGLVVLIWTIGLIWHFKLKYDFTKSYEKLYKEKVSIESQCEPYLEYKSIQLQTNISREYANYLEKIRSKRHKTLFDKIKE